MRRPSSLPAAKSSQAGAELAREQNHMQPSAARACLLPAARQSRGLLDEQIASLLAGNVSYCELRAASACARSAWCTAANLRGSGMLGPFSAHTILSEDDLRIQASELDGSEGGGEGKRDSGDCAVGRLFHRIRGPRQSNQIRK